MTKSICYYLLSFSNFDNLFCKSISPLGIIYCSQVIINRFLFAKAITLSASRSNQGAVICAKCA